MVVPDQVVPEIVDAGAEQPKPVRDSSEAKPSADQEGKSKMISSMIERADTLVFNIPRDNLRRLSIIELGRKAISWDKRSKPDDAQQGQKMLKPKPKQEYEQFDNESAPPPSLKQPRAATAVFFLLSSMAVAAGLQHCVVQLFVASFPGNKFVNGVLFGIAESFGFLLSNLLLLYLDDIVAFRVAFVAGITSYLVMVFASNESHPVIVHAALVTLIGSLGS